MHSEVCAVLTKARGGYLAGILQRLPINPSQKANHREVRQWRGVPQLNRGLEIPALASPPLQPRPAPLSVPRAALSDRGERRVGRSQMPPGGRARRETPTSQAAGAGAGATARTGTATRWRPVPSAGRERGRQVRAPASRTQTSRRCCGPPPPQDGAGHLPRAAPARTPPRAPRRLWEGDGPTEVPRRPSKDPLGEV